MRNKKIFKIVITGKKFYSDSVIARNQRALERTRDVCCDFAFEKKEKYNPKKDKIKVTFWGKNFEVDEPDDDELNQSVEPPNHN